jgi:hypothetical protein
MMRNEWLECIYLGKKRLIGVYKLAKEGRGIMLHTGIAFY